MQRGRGHGRHLCDEAFDLAKLARGGLIGAGWETFLRYSPFTRLPLAQFLASGVGTLIILLFLPGGIGGMVYDLRDNILRRVALRKGIHVPSLVADKRLEEEAQDHALEEAAAAEGAELERERERDLMEVSR